jgi:hypothetical protein
VFIGGPLLSKKDLVFSAEDVAILAGLLRYLSVLAMIPGISILTDGTVIDAQRNYRIGSISDATRKSEFLAALARILIASGSQRSLAYRLGAAIIDNTGCHQSIDNYRCGNGDRYNGNNGSQRCQPVTSMLPILSDNDTINAN